MTITGSGFCNDLAAVNFGATPETGLPNVIDDNTATAVSPAHAAGTVDVTVITGGGTSATSSADHFTFITQPSGVFTPEAAPLRVLDTRLVGGAIGPNGTRTLSLATKVPGNATAVVINVTATGTTAISFFTVYPTGSSKPVASNLNWTTGRTVANLVMVALGTGQSINIFNRGGKAHAVVDLEGYYAPASGGSTAGGFVGLSPARITDTRTGSGKPNAGSHLAAGGILNVQVTGAGGVPGTGAAAVVFNVTVTNTTAASFLTVYPTGSARPVASNLNWTTGQTLPNRVVVSIGTGGKIAIYNRAGKTDVIVDVNGYFTDATASGKQFVALTPSRILDTRNGTGGITGKVGANVSIVVHVAGQGGVPTIGSSTPPSAVVINVTVTGPTGTSFLTVYPDGTVRPVASDLNFTAGKTVPNLVVVTLGTSGDIQIYNRAYHVYIIVDVFGWYG